MTEKREDHIKLPKSLMVEENDPFEIVTRKAFQLYMDYGRFGAGLISKDAERTIEIELDALTAYTASLAKTSADLLRAVTDPVKIEESRQHALSFYHLVLASLPPTSN